jgi:23S rRNA pseudouridine1911/1915/1917 synthase
VDEWLRVDLDRGDVGVRIDRVLMRHLTVRPGMSRTRIQKLIAAGDVLINGLAASRVAWRVAAGDDVRVRIAAPGPRSRPAPEPGPLDVLHEDDHLLIVNKPAGVVSHPSFGHA